MKKIKDILIFIWLLIFTVLLGIVCSYAFKRLTEDKNTSAQVDANQCEQISQLNAKIDSLENMIMRGQKPKNTSVKVDANQRELKSQLRLENDDLKNQLKSQLDFMERQIEYEEKVVDDLKGNITFWFCFVTIVVTIIAIGVPLYNMGEIKDKQKEIENDLKSAKESYNKMKEQIESMNKTVAQAKQAAYDAEANVKASMVVDEKAEASADAILKKAYDTAELSKSIDYYGKLISNYPDYSKIHFAYNNRGVLRFASEKYEDALKDYKEAILKKDDVDYFYTNRADCYRKLAEKEQDLAKKNELKTKAEEDEKKAEELKQKGK